MTTESNNDTPLTGLLETLRIGSRSSFGLKPAERTKIRVPDEKEAVTG